MCSSDLSVSEQLEGFQKDQFKYKLQAEKTAEEWFSFEVELALSLKTKKATYEIQRFIAVLQHMWDEEGLRVIKEHELAGNNYKMSNKLAAILERAKQNIINSNAALATNNKQVLVQIKPEVAKEIQNQIKQIDTLRHNNASDQQIMVLQAQLDRNIAGQNLRAGGGCAGINRDSFSKKTETVDGRLDTSDNDTVDDKENWKWKIGNCRIKVCISPKPTKVGPCQICERCQHKFDQGEDLTKVNSSKLEINLGRSIISELIQTKPDDQKNQKVAEINNDDKVDNVVNELISRIPKQEQPKYKAHTLEMAA